MICLSEFRRKLKITQRNLLAGMPTVPELSFSVMWRRRATSRMPGKASHRSRRSGGQAENSARLCSYSAMWLQSVGGAWTRHSSSNIACHPPRRNGLDTFTRVSLPHARRFLSKVKHARSHTIGHDVSHDAEDIYSKRTLAKHSRLESKRYVMDFTL